MRKAMVKASMQPAAAEQRCEDLLACEPQQATAHDRKPHNTGSACIEGLGPRLGQGATAEFVIQDWMPRV